MSEVKQGDASPITRAHLAQRALVPLDGQIWRITAGDYVNKEVFDSSEDIDESEGVTLIFGRGTFGAFDAHNTSVYGQGEQNTVIAGSKQRTTTLARFVVPESDEGVRVCSYACTLTGGGTAQGVTFQNDGQDEGADICTGLITQTAFYFVGDCQVDARYGNAATHIDWLIVAGVVFGNRVSSPSNGGQSILEDNATIAELQSCLLLGSTESVTKNLHHNLTVSVTNSHQGKGYIMAAGVMYYLDGTNPATSVNALLDIVLALP